MDQAQTVKKAFEIVEILGEHRTLTASQINSYTGFHRSTNYRLLSTLLQLGYIKKNDATGLYSLSGKFIGLASKVVDNRNIVKAAKPYLEELYNTTGETIHLAIIDRDELVYLDKMESQKSLRVVMSSRAGGHAPLYCTGIGKVLLAGMAPAEKDKVYHLLSFVPYTENTITSPGVLENELELIRERGYAEDREEHEPGVCCVAAPIHNSLGDTVAGLSISLPSIRYTEQSKQGLIDAVMQTAQKISAALS